MTRTVFVLFSVLAAICLPLAAHAQLVQPAALPAGLSGQSTAALNQERGLLLEQGNSLRQRISAHNQQCGSVAENSPLVAQCQSNQASLVSAIQQYNAAVNDFNQRVQHLLAQSQQTPPVKPNPCSAAEHQMEMDRREIERQMRSNEMSQQELEEWKGLNGKAQKEAVVASAKFVLGEFAADLDPVRGSVSQLERQVSVLARKAANSRKYSTRMNYLAQLDTVVDQLKPLEGALFEKTIVGAGLDANKTWELARNTMQHQFRMAAKQNEDVRALLIDPKFKEAFTGDSMDAPGAEVVTTLAEQAMEEAGKFVLGVEKYDKFTGPAVRAATFVRDAAYTATLSYLSTQRVLQQNDLAGALAKSAGALQQRYKKSVDALRACRATAQP
jgi:hypothetical protein